MTDPYLSNSNPASAEPSSRPPPSLPAPLLHPYSFSSVNSQQTRNPNSNGAPALPSIPPFSSLPVASSPPRTSPADGRPSAMQLPQPNSNNSAARFDQMRPPHVHPSQSQQHSSQSNPLDRAPSPRPFPAHPLPSHLHHFEPYSRTLPQQPINPLHPSRQSQSLPLPSPIDLPRPNPSVLPGFHPSPDGSKNDKPLIPPPLQHPLPSDNSALRFVPSMHNRLQPLIPPFQSFPELSRVTSPKPKSSSQGTAQSHALGLQQPSRSSTERHPPQHPRPPQVPPPLPPRPTMLAGPRGPAVMQTIPDFQRSPLPPRSTHSNHRAIQGPGRPPSTPEFNNYRPDVILPPYNPTRSVILNQQTEDRASRPSPESDLQPPRRDLSSSPSIQPRQSIQAIQSRTKPQGDNQLQTQSHSSKESHPLRSTPSRSHSMSQLVQPQPQKPQTIDEPNVSRPSSTDAQSAQGLQPSKSPPPNVNDRKPHEFGPIRMESIRPESISIQQSAQDRPQTPLGSSTQNNQQTDSVAQLKPTSSAVPRGNGRASPTHSTNTIRSGEVQLQKAGPGTPQHSVRSSDRHGQHMTPVVSGMRGQNAVLADRPLSQERISSPAATENVTHSNAEAPAGPRIVRESSPGSPSKMARGIPALPGDARSGGMPLGTDFQKGHPPEQNNHAEQSQAKDVNHDSSAKQELPSAPDTNHDMAEQLQQDNVQQAPLQHTTSKIHESIGVALDDASKFKSEKQKSQGHGHALDGRMITSFEQSGVDVSSAPVETPVVRQSSPSAWKLPSSSVYKSFPSYANVNHERLDTPDARHANAWTSETGAALLSSPHTASQLVSDQQDPSSISRLFTLPHAQPPKQPQDFPPSIRIDRPLGRTSSSHSQTDDATAARSVIPDNSPIDRGEKSAAHPTSSALMNDEDNAHLSASEAPPNVPSNSSVKPEESLVATPLEPRNLVGTNQTTNQDSGNSEHMPHQDTVPIPQPNGPESADSAGLSQRKQLKVEDALAYLEKVKIQFADQLNVYNQFLDIMKEFKKQDIDTAEVIKRVSELFRGHKDLILGFNTFLPPGYKIQVTENLATGALNAGFVGPQGKFSELPTYHGKPSPKPPPLRSSLTKKPAPPPPRPKDIKRPPPSEPMENHSAPSPVPTPVPVVRSKESVSSTPNGTPTIKPIPSLMKSTSPCPPPKPQVMEDSDRQASPPVASLSKSGDSHEARSCEFERAMGFMTKIKERFSEDQDTFNEFLKAMKHFRDEQKTIREVFDTVAHLFGPHKDLLSQFKEFIPVITCAQKQAPQPPYRRSQEGRMTSLSNHPSIGRSSPLNSMKKKLRTRDLKFFDKMKSQLGPNKSHLYTEFIKCLSLLSQGIVSQEELVLLTSEILRDCPDAQNAFLSYLDSLGTDDGATSAVDESSSSSSEREVTPVDEERMRYYRTKPMSEIAAECGHDAIVSYRRMPRDFPKYTYSGRIAQERRILNDTWVNVTTGSEDYAFLRKNSNEDNLFRAEDDRYELDMVISTNRATIQKLEVVVSTMSKLPPSEKKRHALASGVLSAIHFNSIRRIYGTHGDEVVSQVRMNPSVAVPIVIPRLKQKDAEWRKVRSDMNRVWREVGERNFHRSLDHRSSFFKHIDKKDLNMKSLVMDIMDPANSINVRDAEMTRARNYQIPRGAGGAFDRSGATKAVIAAAQISRDIATRSLELKFEKLWIHKVTYNLIQSAVTDDASADVKKGIIEFAKLLENYFDVDLARGTRRKGICDTAMFGAESQAKEGESNEGPTEKNKEMVKGPRDDIEVLFGDEAIYVMFRLYHVLYERIFIALELAHEQVRDRQRREKLNQAAANGVPTESIIKARTLRYYGDKESDCGFSLGPEAGNGVDVFKRFLEIAKPFVRGKIEWTKYEEKCRVLLGTGSYCVFTLDKVMQRLTKQIGTVFGGDRVAQELIGLFEQSHDALRRSEKLGGKLNRHGVEQLYAVATSRHVAQLRPPGSHLMRFCREYCRLDGKTVEIGDVRLRGVLHKMETGMRANTDDEVNDDSKDDMGCALVIEVLGETGDDDYVKGQQLQQGRMDDFLEFCGSYEDCGLHGQDAGELSNEGGVGGERHFQDSSRKLGSHNNSHEQRDHKNGGKTQGSRNGQKGSNGSEGSHRKNRDHKRGIIRDDSTERTLLKRRHLDVELRRFRPEPPTEALRRSEAVVMENGLHCKVGQKGEILYTSGTMDWMAIPGKKRRYVETNFELAKINEQSSRTTKFRKLLKLSTNAKNRDGSGNSKASKGKKYQHDDDEQEDTAMKED